MFWNDLVKQVHLKTSTH